MEDFDLRLLGKSFPATLVHEITRAGIPITTRGSEVWVQNCDFHDAVEIVKQESKGEKAVAQWYCNRCKQKFPNAYEHERHHCSEATGTPYFRRPSMMIKCASCGNSMSYEKYHEHGCVTKGKADTKENGILIGLFVSPKRIDTQSMRLAAAEFRGAHYIARGVSAEAPFIKIAKEMGAAVTVTASETAEMTDTHIMKKVEMALMFPSKEKYQDNQILKFSLNIGGHKVPTVVYPER